MNNIVIKGGGTQGVCRYCNRYIIQTERGWDSNPYTTRKGFIYWNTCEDSPGGLERHQPILKEDLFDKLYIKMTT